MVLSALCLCVKLKHFFLLWRMEIVVLRDSGCFLLLFILCLEHDASYSLLPFLMNQKNEDKNQHSPHRDHSCINAMMVQKNIFRSRLFVTALKFHFQFPAGGISSLTRSVQLYEICICINFGHPSCYKKFLSVTDDH